MSTPATSEAPGPRSDRTLTTEQIEVRRQIGTAWRQIRRGASAIRIKDLFYGAGPEGLDLALADALTVLCQSGPMRMGELAEALHITPASTTRAVTCLVDKGYAKRVKDAGDQRSIVVSATDAGQERHLVIAARVQSGLDQILSEFDPHEQLLLAEFLGRFVGSVERYVESEDARGSSAADSVTNPG